MALLNQSTAVRRMVTLVFVFTTIFFVLRLGSNNYTDYLPAWRTPSSTYDPSIDLLRPEHGLRPGFDKPIPGTEYEVDSEFKTLPIEEPGLGWNDESLKPGNVVGKPEDILPEVLGLPELSNSPGSESVFEDEYTQRLPTGSSSTGHEQEEAEETKPTSPRSRLSKEMQEILAWNPPVEIKAHYPPYDQYANRDYDPNRWQDFERY